MAYNKGTFIFPANYQVTLQEPLDARLVKPTKADLINKENWPYDGDTIYVYKNMLVSTDEGIFKLVDVDKVLSPDYSGWEQVCASTTTTLEVVDNLQSDSSTAALSARQGKLLAQDITGVRTLLSSEVEKLTKADGELDAKVQSNIKILEKVVNDLETFTNLLTNSSDGIVVRLLTLEQTAVQKIESGDQTALRVDDSTPGVITLIPVTCSLEEASNEKDGLATANNVKSYINQKVSGINSWNLF